MREQPEVRTYVPLGPKVTFASRASVGFLVASNYGNVVQEHLNDAVTPANEQSRVSDIETVFFRGFFSGGPTSNRGFPLRGVAPHGIVPFLNPATASQQAATSCDPQAQNYDPSSTNCSIPIGLSLIHIFVTPLPLQTPLQAAREGQGRRFGVAIAFVLLLILLSLALSIVLKPRGHDMPAELSQRSVRAMLEG